MAEINLIMGEDEELSLDIESDGDSSLDVGDVVEVITSDYQKLNNKPSINGTELFDNYDEIDPTVPNWAKGDEPTEMSITEIYDIWQSVFN